TSTSSTSGSGSCSPRWSAPRNGATPGCGRPFARCTMTSARYVYAILPRDARPPSGLTGWGGGPLPPVAWGNVAALTSSGGAGGPRRTPASVLRHAAIVEGLREVGPTLPVRFGTVLGDVDAVRAALAQRYDVLVADLER